MVKTKSIKPKEKRTIVSNKKRDRDQFIKEMDMIRLKQKINEIMKKVSNDKSKIENNNTKYQKNIQLINEKYADNESILYQNMFQKYIKNEFTLICVSFVNKIIIDIKRNHLEQYEGKYNFNKLFMTLAKELLLNEFELILLSLYLEYIDISLYLNTFSMEESLLFLCFYIKKISINDSQIEPINSYLKNKYQNFNQNYDKWYKINEKKINDKSNFSYIEINERFKEYNSPFNIYCGDNYIDYNYIVDRILTMSLPYVDVKKENNNNNATINNNNSILSSMNDNNISNSKENNNISNNNINNNNITNNINNNSNYSNANKSIGENNFNDNNYINNNYINNNYINNNYINSNKINLNVDQYKDLNKQILQPEPFININTKNKNIANQNLKNEILNNTNYNNILNKNNNNFIKENNNNSNKFIINNNASSVTPNNLLHSLSNINRFILNPTNNKMLISPNLIGSINNRTGIECPVNNFIDIDKPNIVQSSRQIEEDFGPRKMGSNLIINPLQTPSQSSFLFQQKPSLMEINLFNRNNSSHIFDDDGDTLKQILRASNDNYFRSSISFDSPKYPYSAFINSTNNNLMNINNSTNNNNMEQKGGDINKRKFNNDIPFRPLNIICNKNNGNTSLNPNKILYTNNNNFGNLNNNINNEKQNTDNLKKQ